MQSQSFIIVNGYALVILVILCFIFFGKKRLHKIEDNIYAELLILCFLTIFIGVLLGVLITYNYLSMKYYIILSKIYWSGLISLVILLTFYGYCITNLELNNLDAYHKRVNIMCIINLIVIFFLPIKFNISEIGIINEGIAVFYSFGVMFLFYLLLIAILLKNIKEISKKKYIPLNLLVFETIVITILNIVHPEYNFIINLFMVVNCLIMYFTIENPDVRLLEYEKREKELAISASEAKSAFLSSMSHELRTPLNAIVGLSEDIMTYQDTVPQEVKEDSIDIVNASNTLLEIIGNILDISKIEGGKLELIESDYLPKEEVESLLKLMRVKVEEKDLILNSYIDPNIPECLYGDRLRIKQIINNFLSNAIKYTEKGSVNFSINWVNDSLEIKVSDTGRGIKEEDRDKLFTQFERLNVEKTSSVQGTGLGLSITKNLVELMGGSVKVESVYGQGSTFSCIIPQKIGNKDLIVREALSADEKQSLDFSGKHLLIVDDNKLNIKVLKKAIESFHFEIDECYDGKTAIDKINAGNYDLIFMDIMMPIMGGEEAIKILKENPDFKTPVVALTADAVSGAKERYLACGFVDYVAKPFSRDDISIKLDKILNTK